MGPKIPAAASPMRVVTLLPSATENFCALLKFAKERRGIKAPGIAVPAGSGLPQLVGRSHECDTPNTPDVQSLPILTAARTAFTNSADVHKQVREALADASSLYHLDATKLVELQPDLILTQSTCKVCSIDLASVSSVLDGTSTCSTMGDTTSARPEIPEIPGKTTKIITTNPISLHDVLVTQFQQLGKELLLEDEGNAMAQQHLDKIQTLQALGKERRRLAGSSKVPRVLLVEWLDPLFIGKMGWMREIIEYASARVVESLESMEKEPIDIVIVACCGLSIEKSQLEISHGRVGDWWAKLASSSSSENPQLFLVDGMSMFSRPTPKLLLALEWLVNVAHGGPEAAKYLATTTFPYKKVNFDFASTTTTEEERNKNKQEKLLEDIEELHRVACVNKQATYSDPATGYSVMTSYNLQSKQICCGNGCRHCPFGHVNVKDPSRRTNKLTQTVILQPKRRQKGTRAGGQILWPSPQHLRENAHLENQVDICKRDLIVMFWSGGKDSFLSLATLYAQYAKQSAKPMPRVVLLTSIDPVTNTVPIQNITHGKIVQQANALGLPLCTVAVGLGHSYAPQIHEALAELPAKMAHGQGSGPSEQVIHSLVFGDLHLQDIRAWREETFGNMYRLQFPVWQKDYESELQPMLREICDRTQSQIVFANIESELLRAKGYKIGDPYQMEDLRAHLRSSQQDINDFSSTSTREAEAEKKEKEENGDGRLKAVDLMGECGEFHTCVLFPGMTL